MKEFGKQLKMIRINKGIYQKSLYYGLSSRQYGRKLEIGESIPNFFLFLDILNRLDISTDEFLYILNDYSYNQKENMRYQISLAYNNKNHKLLLNIYNDMPDSLDERNFFLKCLTHILYVDLTGLYLDRSNYLNNVNFIKEYLFNRNTWYISEINDYTACFHLFEEEANSYLLPKCLKQLKKYTNYKTYKLMTTNLLTNYLFNSLENNQLINIKLVVDELNKMYSEYLYDDFLCKLQCKFALNCYEFFINSNVTVFTDIEKIISILHFFDYTEKEHEFLELLSVLQKKYKNIS